MHRLNRRDFLTRSTLYGAGAAMALGMGAGVFNAAPAHAGKAAFPQGDCAGADGQGPSVLVAYASRCGSTGGIAQAVAQALCAGGARARVSLAREVESVKEYDAVVVGSAVRSDSWLSEAIEFVGDNQAELKHKPTAYFLACLALCRPGEEARRKAMSYFDPAFKAAPQIKPLGLGLFAGALDYSKFNFIMRAMVRSRMDDRGVKEGDYRDFAAIKAWAGGLSGGLGVKAAGA